MIPVFYVEDIIMKAEQSGATVKEIVRAVSYTHLDVYKRQSLLWFGLER